MRKVWYSKEMVSRATLENLHLCTLEIPGWCIQGTWKTSTKKEVEAFMMKIIKEELSPEEYEDWLKNSRRMQK